VVTARASPSVGRSFVATRKALANFTPGLERSDYPGIDSPKNIRRNADEGVAAYLANVIPQRLHSVDVSPPILAESPSIAQ